MLNKNIFFILIFFNISLLATSNLDLIELNKKINLLEKQVYNLETHTILMNENLKTIDYNFQQIILMLNDLKYDTTYRKRKIKLKHQHKSAPKNIYKIIEDTYLYQDLKGTNKLFKLYSGELIEIDKCINCDENKNCFCKLKNQNKYIKFNKLKKEDLK